MMENILKDGSKTTLNVRQWLIEVLRIARCTKERRSNSSRTINQIAWTFWRTWNSFSWNRKRRTIIRRIFIISKRIHIARIIKTSEMEKSNLRLNGWSSSSRHRFKRIRGANWYLITLLDKNKRKSRLNGRLRRLGRKLKTFRIDM